MSSGQLFGVIDNCLRELSEKLGILRQLFAAHTATSQIVDELESLLHRIELEERMIRLRLSIASESLKNRGDYNPQLLGGVPEEEIANRIIREVRACQELCRTLEEYFKFFKLEKVAHFYKLMRFDLYEFERRCVSLTGTAIPGVSRKEEAAEPYDNNKNRFSRALSIHPLYFILDASLCKNREAVRVGYDAVAGGVKVIQTRFKSLSNRRYLDLARKLKGICAEKDCLLIVNDRLDVALLSGADGVHVGSDDFSIAEIRSLSSGLIIGRSARSAQDALDAQSQGADYIGSGAVYASSTKQTAPVIGTRGLATIVRAVNIPVVGIGGITEENYEAVLKSGAAGFCSIGPFRARRSVRNLAAEFKRHSRQQARSHGT